LKIGNCERPKNVGRTKSAAIKAFLDFDENQCLIYDASTNKKQNHWDMRRDYNNIYNFCKRHALNFIPTSGEHGDNGFAIWKTATNGSSNNGVAE